MGPPKARRLFQFRDDGHIANQDRNIWNQFEQNELAPEHVDTDVHRILPQIRCNHVGHLIDAELEILRDIIQNRHHDQNGREMAL